MSRPVKFSWPVASVNAICLSQPMAGAGALVINGALASAEGVQNRVATFEGLERTVSITSAGDISLVSFTITGTLRGAVVSETRAGPNATTVYTTQKFTTITSVTVNGALIANASIGSGATGSTFWFLSDYHRANNALAISVVVTANLTYSFETTFDDIATVASPTIIAPIDGVTIPVIPAGGSMQGSAVTALANYTIPTRFSRIRVSAADATGAATIYFLQQGIL